MAGATGRLERGLGMVGRILDEQGLGGAQTIRAALLAQAGCEAEPCVQKQIGVTLACFRAVLEVDRIDDLVELWHGKPVYRPGIPRPCIYHLRLLAFTRGWRTEENRTAVAASVARLARLGVVQRVPELERQANELTAMLAAGGGRFTKKLSHGYFGKWGAYTGLMLEKDWREPRRRVYDLTFRSLLILHYVEREAVR